MADPQVLYGLRSRLSGGPIPLKAIKIYAKLNTFTADVILEQHYFNDSNSHMEVEYKFPLDDACAIYHFEANINGKKLVGKVEEKVKAEQRYSDAIAAGKGAYLLSKEGDDLFSMNVGNLPPKQSVILKLGYVSELSVQGDSVIFDLIPNIFPGYKQDIYFEAEFLMAFPIMEIKSQPSNSRIPFTIINNNNCNAMLSSEQSNIKFTQDQLVLHIKLQEPHKPCIFTEVAPRWGTRAYALHFFPSTPYRECSAELIFVLDRSGSMTGGSINMLKQTMFQVLKHLPLTAKFNIVGFGTSFTFLFPENVTCNPQSIRKARKHISTLQADLGSTNLYGPLQAIFNKPITSPEKDAKRPDRIVFVLTDGGVDNRSDVIKLVKRYNKQSSVFSFGIGGGVDTQLVNDLASSGKGLSRFISGENEEEMEREVISMLHTAVEPSLEKVELTWHGKNGEILGNKKIQQAPFKLPPIFNKQLFTVYGLIENGKEELSHVTLKASGKAGGEEFTLYCSEQKETEGLLIHRLTARTLIREIEEKSNKISTEDEKKIVDLSVVYNIASTFASFVIVEERQEPVMETMDLVKLSAPNSPYNSLSPPFISSPPLSPLQSTSPPQSPSYFVPLSSSLSSSSSSSSSSPYSSSPSSFLSSYVRHRYIPFNMSKRKFVTTSYEEEGKKGISQPTPSQSDRHDKVRQDIEDVKAVMLQNIDKMFERGERIEALATTTDAMKSNSYLFKKSAVMIRRRMWCRNAKLIALLVGVILFIVLVILLLVFLLR